jgi:replicative DNA helicase
MIELALIRSLMQKDFYEDHRGSKCPDRLFSKDVRKIKNTLDEAMGKHERNLSLTELQALFFSDNGTMTSANKASFEVLFSKLSKEEPMNNDIAKEVLSKLFQQMVGEEVANIGFDYVNGTKNNLEPLRNILDNYQDDFTPSFKFKGDDISFNTLVDHLNLKFQWKFNIPSLRRRVEGLSGGHFVIVGARPNTGKTSFHASIIASEGGFIEQGAKCVVLCNEEAYKRVGLRYLYCKSNMSSDQVLENRKLALERYDPLRNLLSIKDATDKSMDYVEQLAKSVNPDIIVLDMGDKFATGGSERTDIYLKEAAIHARNIAKKYNCVIIWMSQLSAEAEGKINVNQSMLEGSKTGKAAEADLMLLISKNPDIEGQDSNDPQRHIRLAKNKLTGWHGAVHVELDVETGRYSA